MFTYPNTVTNYGTAIVCPHEKATDPKYCFSCLAYPPSYSLLLSHLEPVPLARLIGGLDILEHQALQALAQHLLYHLHQLLLPGYEFELGELDPGADLLHVLVEQVPPLPQRPAHKVLAVVVNAVEDKQARVRVLEV
jgi:hypothetical protein